MWIRVCLNQPTNINLKNGRNRSFPHEPKDQYHLSQEKKQICGAQSLKERRLLSESVFIQLKNEL